MNNPLNNLKKRQIWKTFLAYPAAAFVILEAVDLFISNYGLNPKILSLMLILLIGGFFIALIWNWNHGEKGAQAYSQKEKLAYALIIALSISSAGYYWINSPATGRSTITDSAQLYNKLAIFPFENKSEDASLVYLSDGIPENLINRLSITTNLKVLSKNSTFILDESDRTSSGVKKKLNADLMLTGRIEHLKNQLVIHCQLISVLDDIQIWGDRIFYDNDDVIHLEESIVNSLLLSLPGSLKKSTTPSGSHASKIPEAQAHFMKGRALSYGSTEEETEKALEHFRKAIEIDPEFAAAYIAIANEKIIQAMFSTATKEEIFNEARTAVQTALAFDPNSAEAYYVDGAIRFYGNFDWDGAEKSYKKSIELNPYNSRAYIRYSAFLGAMKRHQESIIMADKAIELDPISISSLHNLGWVHLIARNFKQSEEAFSEAISLHPTWIWGYVKRAYAYVFQGKFEEAEADAVKARELMGEWGTELLESALIFIYGACNNNEKQAELIEHFFERVNEDNYRDPFAVFSVYNSSGDQETAMDWAERSLREREAGSYLFNIDVFYNEDLLTHPRFIKVREDMNF